MTKRVALEPVVSIMRWLLILCLCTEAMAAEAPWSLTADGQALELRRVDARAVVEGPLAFTELHLYFRNSEPRAREGTFTITMPPTAAISRFAMEGTDGWMEAEIVEQALARRAYEDFLHRKQDPALLEKVAGNQFSARIFPIEANGDKHVVIAYSHIVDAKYRLPLVGLSRADVTITVNGTQQLAKKAWVADRDFEASTSASGVRAGDLAVAQVVLPAGVAEPAPKAVSLLVDTSASRALGFDAYVTSIEKLVRDLRAKWGDFDLDVIAFDQNADAIYHGAAARFDGRALRERGAGGASDLGTALALAAGQRVIVVGDGVITAGEDRPVVAAQRLDFVLAGGLRDEAAAQRLARNGLVTDLDAAVDALTSPVVDAPIVVANATWSSPKRVHARGGSTLTVFAKLTGDLDVAIGSTHQKIALAPASQPLVERAIAKVEIDEMEGNANARAALVAKSIASRVLSSETSFLVLETAADFKRFGIDRRANNDVLVVGAHGLERQASSTRTRLAKRPPAKQHPANPEAELKRMIDSGEYDQMTSLLQELSDDRDYLAEHRELAETVEHLRAQSMRKKAERLERNAADTEKFLKPMEPAPRVELPAAPVRVENATHDPREALREARALQQNIAEDTAADELPDRAALSGDLAEIHRDIARGAIDKAIKRARDWQRKDPGDVLALVGLGDALAAKGDARGAARAAGSIIDLYPNRADLRRFAGERLGNSDLAIDTLRRAVADRPDHLTGHRLLAYALLRAGKPAEAFAAILAGIDQQYPDGRFLGGLVVLADDAGIIGAAYAAAVPSERAAIEKQLAKRELVLATKPSTRFVLYWETDANDVDLHVVDAKGQHASYRRPKLPSGGELYADVRTGYGPECFAITGKPAAAPYKLAVHYYSQGPMGYGMGMVQIQRFDGKAVTLEDRPFVIMNDRAVVQLGAVK